MQTILAAVLALLLTALPRAGEAATVVFKFVSEPMVLVAEPPAYLDSFREYIGQQFTIILKMTTDDPSNISANFYWVPPPHGIDEDLPVTNNGVTLTSAWMSPHGATGYIFNTLSITTDPDGKHHFDGNFAHDTPDFLFGDDWFAIVSGSKILAAPGAWVKATPVPLPAAGWLLFPGLIALAAIRRRS